MKQLSCLYAGGAAGLATAFTAALVFGVSAPVALLIGYAFAGGGIAAAVSIDD